MKGKETKHIKIFQSNKVKEGENIIAFLEGWIGDLMGRGSNTQHNGMFILTNLRVCFFRKGIFGEVFQTIPISKLTSIETKSFMGHRTIALHTSHDELSFKTFEEKQLFESVYEALEKMRSSDSDNKSVNESIPNSTILEFQNLKELREGGLITEEEFLSKKEEFLARI